MEERPCRLQSLIAHTDTHRHKLVTQGMCLCGGFGFVLLVLIALLLVESSTLFDFYFIFLPCPHPNLVDSQWNLDTLQRVGGVDISFIKGNDVDACVSLVVLTYPNLEVSLRRKALCLFLQAFHNTHSHTHTHAHIHTHTHTHTHALTHTHAFTHATRSRFLLA